jgi:hypothetical protein
MSNDIDWEKVYESILKDIVNVLESSTLDYAKLERITEMLVGNDFMEKPSLY